MRLSEYFLPTMKETPSEAQVISHRLMLRSGMIHQSSSGIYSWLPMGSRVLKNIENIVREEQDFAGAQEVIMPTIQSADLWRESGRYDAYGAEMLRMQDRHDRDMLYSPTAEEVVADIARKHIKSYRELPKMLYQIQWKFRDEIRPRFGVMRGREFLMKDAYSLDLDQDKAKESYIKMMKAYLRTFKRIGLAAVPVKAPTGPIGGDLSHEFHVLASTGESLIYYDKRLDEIASQDGEIDIDELMTIYAKEEGMHDPDDCPVAEGNLKTARGIEIGHIFYFACKYSDAMNATVADQEGDPVKLHMGSYGIGISRLVGAIIEASHDDAGIIWPESIAPYKVGLANLRFDDQGCADLCAQYYQELTDAGIAVLYDDRNERTGVKLADLDLIGLPWQLRVGPRGLKSGTVEVKNRKTGECIDVPKEGAIQFLHSKLA